MMIRLRLGIALVVAIAVLAPAAHAVIYYEWNSNGDFCMPGDPENTWDKCVYKVHNPWFGRDPFEWEYPTDDPEYAYSQSGTVPPDDPIVNQLFRNRTTSNWTDWHCTISGGTIVVDSVVVKNNQNPTPVWNITYHYDNNSGACDGFYAETIPGSGTYIAPDGLLSVYFEYVGSGTVTFNQYPTTTAPIPEPASVACLLSGLLALAGVRRKK